MPKEQDEVVQQYLSEGYGISEAATEAAKPSIILYKKRKWVQVYPCGCIVDLPDTV